MRIQYLLFSMGVVIAIVSCHKFDCSTHRVGLLMLPISKTETYDLAYEYYERGVTYYELDEFEKAAVFMKKAGDEFSNSFLPLQKYQKYLCNSESLPGINKSKKEHFLNALNENLALVNKNRKQCYLWAMHMFSCVGKKKEINEIENLMVKLKPVVFSESFHPCSSQEF